MRLGKIVYAVTLAFAFVLCSCPLAAQQEIHANHPNVPAFTGMAIASGTVSELDALDFPLDGAQAVSAEERRKPKHAEGKTWRFTYQLEQGARRSTPPEIVHFYGSRFETAGGKLMYRGEGSSEATFMMPLGAGERWVHLLVNNDGEQIMMEIVETATAEPLPPRPLETSHIGCANCLWRAEVERRGEWKFHFGADHETQFPAAERQEMRARLKEIADLIHATPVLNPPMGVEAEATARFDAGCERDPALCHWKPMVQGSFETALHMLLLNVKTAERSMQSTESPALHLKINDPTEIFRHHEIQKILDEDGSPIVSEPAAAARFAAVTLLDNQVIVLSRSSRPLWTAVPRERYLRAIIRSRQQQLAKEGSPRSAEDLVVKQIREELEALSPEERTSVAYVGCRCGTLSDLAAAEAKGATRVVVFNPGYFDRALPRTAVQLITVRTDEPYNNCELTGVCELDDRWDLRSVRLWQLVRAIDYERLRKLLPAPLM